MGVISNSTKQAKKFPKRIVFPESDEERTLKAIDKIIKQKIAKPVLVGDPSAIKKKISQLKLKLKDVEVVDNKKDVRLEKYAQQLFQIRKDKGLTIEAARGLLNEPIYFGTMMVKTGDADGLISGAVHPTAHTLRPALQIIKTVKEGMRASGAFFMEFPNKCFIFADCSVNIVTDANTLADIALESYDTANAFGIDPVIAMLSFSTHGSAEHESLNKIRDAVKIVKSKNPSVIIDGEMQVDAALVPEVCAMKAPGSQINGKATVLVFPDISAGNIAYKLVERLAHAKAIGPIIQGLAKPVNDLSRGCSVQDIVDVTAITVVQAQQSDGSVKSMATTKNKKGNLNAKKKKRK
jgi:phosphate acetyltransferase